MGVSDIDNQAHILNRRMDPVNDVLSERQRLYKAGQRPTGYYIDSYYGHDKRDEDYSEISGNAGGMTVGYVLENTNTPMEVLGELRSQSRQLWIRFSQTNHRN